MFFKSNSEQKLIVSIEGKYDENDNCDHSADKT